MKTLKLPLEGSCLCGSVRVSLSALPLLTLACHCRGCQKLCASAYSLTAMFPADSFSITGDLVRGGLRSEGREHYYCRSCLGFVYSRIAGADERVNLRVSVLDDAGALPPYVEVMTDEKQDWAKVSAAYSYSRFPESAEELKGLMESYSKCWSEPVPPKD
ncbi:GFA family protein [Pseudophaeobacter sp.]|uniref:GFA family protein n=1 Tax=Pseudophaeobacter sp. TaxID=1971739 RepID=UPI00329A04AA